MHSIAPYALRCFDPENRRNGLGDYSVLNNIRGHDLYALVKEFLTKRGDGVLEKIEDQKRCYSFSNVEYCDSRREITGFLNAGFYGVGTNIVDIVDGKTVFRKGVNNSEMIQHYIHFFFPLDRDEGICVMSLFRGDGIKTVFFGEFDKFFKSRVPLFVSAQPLSYAKALQEWQDSVAKEIKVTKFNAVKNLEDVEVNGGHLESTLIMKPKRGRNFGLFKNFFIAGSDQAKLVELLNEVGGQIKTTVQLGRRTRVFKVGVVNDNVVCQIDFPDDLELIDGMLKLDVVKPWASDIIKEFCLNLFPGVES